jgi:rare lipoprotein A
MKNHPTRVHASFYGKGFDGKKMANGKKFHKLQPTVAHKTLPLGTMVKITNPETGKSARATVTDRGPYIRGRSLDVSEGLARKLQFVEKGHTDLIMVVLSVPKKRVNTSS